MEAFEQFVALALEAEGFVVSPAVKFNVRRQTRKAAYTEVQEHGYEVDLVGARRDRLLLATVKSFFGSRGVAAENVIGDGRPEHNRRYVLLNDEELRTSVIASAAARYGYRERDVTLRLYAGRFAAPEKGAHEARIRAWAAAQAAGSGPIEVFSAKQVVDRVRAEAALKPKQYRDHPVLVTMKVLEATGDLLPLRGPHPGT